MGIYVDGSQIQLVKYVHEDPFHRMWTSIRIQDPTRLCQEKVAEIIIMALDSIGLPHDHATFTEVEFALDTTPGSPALLGELTNLLQASLTMKHARAGSHSAKDTTHYLGKQGNVRQGTKGIRCYPKEGKVRGLEANRGLLGQKG